MCNFALQQGRNRRAWRIAALVLLAAAPAAAAHPEFDDGQIQVEHPSAAADAVLNDPTGAEEATREFLATFPFSERTLWGAEVVAPIHVPAAFDEAELDDPGLDRARTLMPETAIVPIDPVIVPAPQPPSIWNRFSSGLSEWTSRFSFGSRVLTGNSNQTFVDVAADFEKKSDRQRFTQINLLGQYGESEGDIVANRWFANSTTDFYLGDKWMVFHKVMDQYDQLQNLDYRGTFSGGAGYRFFFEDDRRLVFRVGPGVTLEIFHAPADKRVTPDMFGEVELRLPVWDRLKWEQKTTVFPSLSSLDVARATSQTSVLYAFDEKEQWSLKFGILYQYISQPNVGRLPSDFTTNLSIVYLRK